MRGQRGLAVAGALVAGGLALPVLFPGAVPRGVLLQGLVFGTVHGLLALGLVLVYRTTRIINFAYGAMGGVAGTLGVMLYLEAGWPWPICVLTAVAAGVGIGVATELTVIRRFTNASRLVLTVATIGLAQVLGFAQIMLPVAFDASPLVPSFRASFADVRWAVDPIILTGDEMVIIAVVPLVLAGLTWFLLRTEAGMAVRAIAENHDRARLLGIPVRSLSSIVWAVIGGLAALTVVLRAPSQGLTIDAAAGPAVLLPALAAAVVARMTSLPTAFAAGLGLGVIEAVARWNVDRQSITTIVFLVVILTALLLQRGSSGRAEADDDSLSLGGAPRQLPAVIRQLPEVRAGRAGLLALSASLIVAFGLTAGPSSLIRGSVILIYGIVVLSLVVLTGWGGTVSLGQAAIVGVGGVAASNLIHRFNLDFVLVVILSGVAAAVAAVLIGLPALRVRGLFLAVTTMAFAVAADAFLFNPTNFREWLPTGIQRPVLLKQIDLRDDQAYFFLCLTVLVVAVLLTRNLRRARPGRTLLATRDNPRSAAAMGVAVTRERVVGFAIAGLLAGMAGALHATLLGGVGYHTYDPGASLLLFSMAVIGGIGSISGALLGVALVQIGVYAFPRGALLITGTGVLVVLWALPGGLGQTLELARDRIVRLVARRRGIDLDARVEADDGAGPAQGDRSDGSSPPAPTRVAGDAAPARSDLLLHVRDLTASYGTMQVLFGVDLEVREGEMLALLGTNGAGKSTVLRAVTGLLPPTGGTVLHAGRSLRGSAPDRIARSGVVLMPGGRGVFPTMTVAENLRLATWVHRKDRAVAAEAHDEALALFPRLADRLQVAAGELSGGEQQMLSLAMAFAMRPQLLCIDELSLGLSPAVVRSLCEKVRDIHRGGTTVVVVEQSVSVALTLAERAVFLEKGEVRFTGPTAELLDRPDLLRSVFIQTAPPRDRNGSPEGAAGPARRVGGARLECQQIVKRFGGLAVLQGIDLTVAAGSVVGLVGHNGAGKTTLFDAISGFVPIDAGRVLIDGVDITDLPPHERALTGLGRSFQEARLYPTLSVTESLLVALERHLPNRDPLAAAFALPASFVSEESALERADELLELLGLDRYRHHRTGELSTGTRRIVELACILAQDPAIVLLDEPSAGVAQRETEALGQLLAKVQSDTGCTMLLIEHDLRLLSEVCDELVALEQGAVIATGPPEEVLSHPEVIASYLGTPLEEPAPAAPARSRRRRVPLRA